MELYRYLTSIVTKRAPLGTDKYLIICKKLKVSLINKGKLDTNSLNTVSVNFLVFSVRLSLLQIIGLPGDVLKFGDLR